MAPADALLGALEDGGVAAAMRDSFWLYPLVETTHIVGFSILFGAIAMFDVRLLGASKHISIRLLGRHLLPWSIGALVLIVPTGLMMFAADATDLVSNRAFVMKMLLIMLAGTNAAAFHVGAYRGVDRWDRDMPAPLPARLHATASLLIWIGVIACGRLIAYL